MKARLEVLATIMLILAAGAVLALAVRSFLFPSTGEPPRPPLSSRPLPRTRIDLNGVPLKGSLTARAVMVEYSDFECPVCGRFARETLPTLVKRYVDSGKLLIAFLHLPLESIHPLALRAAEAADCAGASGRFWEMHDSLFVDQRRLDEASLLRRASTLGLQEPAFAKCLEDSDAVRIRQSAAEAKALAITATPTFLIGFKVGDHEMQPALRIDGARPLADFEEALDRATKPFTVGGARKSGSDVGGER